MTVDRKRFGTGNKGVAFHCADCGKDGTPGTDRYFDNKEQKPKPLCVDCMMERAKNEAGALPLDSLISLNKEILDQLRGIHSAINRFEYWMVAQEQKGYPASSTPTQVEEAF